MKVNKCLLQQNTELYGKTINVFGNTYVMLNMMDGIRPFFHSKAI